MLPRQRSIKNYKITMGQTDQRKVNVVYCHTGHEDLHAEHVLDVQIRFRVLKYD
jgi:hypothetical protein